MSVLEPDDSMRAMIDSLGLVEPDPDVNVCLLDELTLMTRFNEVTQELLQIGEVLNPRTEKGRDLHSTRSAYLIEMQRRKLR